MKALVALPIAAALFLGSAHATTPRACTDADLAARVAFQGGTGAMEGGVTLRNRASTACRLHGVVTLAFRAAGRTLAVRNDPGPATSGADGVRTLVLARRAQAFVHATWRNWCGKHHGNVGVRVAIPKIAVRLAAAGTTSTPRCDDRTRPSTVAVGAFERLRHYP
jgi:hypothetical protein